MPQKPLKPEIIEQARQARKEGKAIEAIASELGISVGATSKYTRDIAKPVSRASVSSTRATKRVGEGNTLRVTGKVPPAEATIRAINLADEAEAEAREAKARLAFQTALDEIEDRKQERRKVFDLEVKRREAEIKETETRAKMVTSPSPELTLQLEAAKSETARVERELTELRHQQGMDLLERHFQGQMELLSRQIASINRTGLTSYDLISRGLDKVETLAINAGSKIDSFVSNNRRGKELGMALSLGLSPPEYEALILGPAHPLTAQQFMAYRSGDTQTPPTEEDSEAYARHLASAEARNSTYQVIMAKVSQRLGQGGATSVRTGKPGKAPAPGEPEPPVLKAESKLVTCSRCQTTFDIDLREMRQRTEPGKRLFASCPNPKCGFLLDLSELLGLKVAPQGPAPDCYAGTSSGCASKGTYAQCQDCQYRDFASQVYE